MPKRKPKSTLPVLEEIFRDSWAGDKRYTFDEWLRDGSPWMLDPSTLDRAIVEAYCAEHGIEKQEHRGATRVTRDKMIDHPLDSVER